MRERSEPKSEVIAAVPSRGGQVTVEQTEPMNP